MGLKKNRQYVSDLEQLSDDWVLFRHYFYPDQIDAQIESDFLEIKNRLASGYRTLLSTIDGQVEIAQSMMDILGRISTPQESSRMTQTALKRIEDEWNSVYLLIQETIGLWEYRIEETSRRMNPLNWIKDIFFPSKKKIRDDKSIYRVSKAKKSLWNPTMKFVLTGTVLVILLGIIYMLGILDEYLPF